jgi:hypothetical protein
VTERAAKSGLFEARTPGDQANYHVRARAFYFWCIEGDEFEFFAAAAHRGYLESPEEVKMFSELPVSSGMRCPYK